VKGPFAFDSHFAMTVRLLDFRMAQSIGFAAGENQMKGYELHYIIHGPESEKLFH
jgi:hypothetical protein